MKMRKILACMLALVLLTACAPMIDEGGYTEPSPTVEVTPDTEPTEPTPTPEPTDTEEYLLFTYNLEGTEETVYARRHHSLMGYSMVYENPMLEFEKYEGYDLYVAQRDEAYPEMYIKVMKDSRSVSTIVDQLKKSGADDSGYMRLGGCEARVLHYIAGNQFDDVMKTYYVVQAGTAVYLIENCYFYEAAEGYGIRMAQMVNTIQFEDVPAAKEVKIMFRNKEVTDFTSVIGDSTTLRVGTDTGASVSDVKWTSSDEKVCTVVPNGGTCDVVIEGVGVAKLTVTCGDLSASTVVRGKKTW